MAGTTGSAPSYACRAWVNFDGTRDTTGATSTANTNRLIRSSGNVASVLRNGTGDYTITFTTAMSNANYSVSGTSTAGNGDSSRGMCINSGTGVSQQGQAPLLFTASQFRINVAATDSQCVSIQVFGN